MAYPYSGLQLISLLQKQQDSRLKSHLFRCGTFVLDWRAKVGSFPHPDLETMISAGEPCGRWFIEGNQSRPEDRRNVGDNFNLLRELPLNGYIPGASIRGIVRAWASQYQELQGEVNKLLGYQANNKIYPGKIEFLDAFPEEPTKLTLDIVNPQQKFQVFHEGQCEPHSFYTLGDGEKPIPFKLAIRGVNRATEEDLNTVWGWVRESLNLHGIGSRTASGYGVVKTQDSSIEVLPELPPDYACKILNFKLFSQGNFGPDLETPTLELRPSHWRGWLRSWLLRFFLGVMSPENAKITVGELLGTLDESVDGKQRKGCIQIQMFPGNNWEKYDENGRLRFYNWEGSLRIIARESYLNEIILPIIKFAAMTGGVGRGWRRPLHLFLMERRNNESIEAARGSHLTITHNILTTNNVWEMRNFGLAPMGETWKKQYTRWAQAVRTNWNSRFDEQSDLNAEVFSPRTCAVYLVPGPVSNPIKKCKWATKDVVRTRGEGMKLIYQMNYKKNPYVGGNAGKGQPAHCSWVSIKRINGRDSCQEVVCLFMGSNNTLRSQFLSDLSKIDGAVHLFGCQPDRPPPPNDHP
jgi:CRISPR-associated protein Cmr6